MSARLPGDPRVALMICATAVAAAAAVATAVQVMCAEQAGSMLQFAFPGVEHRPGTAWSIFANNARKLAGVLGLALILQSPWLAGDRRPDDRPRWYSRLRTLCDVSVIGVLVPSVVVTGAGIGAYGTRMVRAVLPHGPIELLAFATALTVYVKAREQVLSVRNARNLAAISALALLLAAVAETYITL